MPPAGLHFEGPATGRPGGHPTCADPGMVPALAIRMVFHLPLRRT